MRRPSRPIRAEVAQHPQHPQQMRRDIRPTIRKVAGGAGLVVLLILLWLIFYQNLPGDLNGFAFKPINTAGPIDQLVKIGAIVVSSGIIAAQWSKARLFANALNPGLLAFLALAAISTVWSIDSAGTLLRFITLAGIVLLCSAIALVGWDSQRFWRVAIPPLMFILIASLLIGMIYPERVIELGSDISQKDAWHGITYQKNQFGMTASVVTILCLHRWLAGNGKNFWTLAGGAVAVTCLALSRSSTSMLATGTCGLFMVLVMRVPVIRQRYTTHVVVAIAATILLYELVIQDLIPGMSVLLSPITNLTGKDTTFSSRGIIWQVIKEHISAAPILGTGYGAYWPMPPSPSSPSYIFIALMYFYPSESHNGYLEVMNDLGAVGVACLLVFMISFMRQGLQLIKFDRSRGVMYLAFLFEQMIANMSESEWFSRSTICIMLILASVCLSRDLLEYRLQARSLDPARRSR